MKNLQVASLAISLLLPCGSALGSELQNMTTNKSSVHPQSLAKLEGARTPKVLEAITNISHGGNPTFTFMKGHWISKSNDMVLHEWWLTGPDQETSMCVQRSFENRNEKITVTTINSYKGAYSSVLDSRLNAVSSEPEFMWTKAPEENTGKSGINSATMIVKVKTGESSEEWRPLVQYELIDQKTAIKSVFNKDGTITRFDLKLVD